MSMFDDDFDGLGFEDDYYEKDTYFPADCRNDGDDYDPADFNDDFDSDDCYDDFDDYPSDDYEPADSYYDDLPF